MRAVYVPVINSEVMTGCSCTLLPLSAFTAHRETIYYVTPTTTTIIKPYRSIQSSTQHLQDRNTIPKHYMDEN
jgi:hypothetical protein